MMKLIMQFLQAKGAGEALLKKFLSFAKEYGPEEARAVATCPQSLEAEFRVKSEVARNIVEADQAAQRITNELMENHINAVWYGSLDYPRRLQEILQKDAPAVLFFRGNKNLLNARGVGFCGSRKASDKGLEITAKCAAFLAHKKICVVSGYAYGVDLYAHGYALRQSGTTIFVLAEGILRLNLKKEIESFLTTENHLFVSQFPPYLTWQAPNAMRRNSTIIGLSEAMILVESGLTGGTYAAGEETLRRKKPLFVIDFATPGPSAEANPHFIECGGKPIRGNEKGRPKLKEVEAIFQEAPKVTDKQLLFPT